MEKENKKRRFLLVISQVGKNISSIPMAKEWFYWTLPTKPHDISPLVKTNVDNQVVATFVIENESTEHGDITLLYLHVLSKYQRCCLLQDHGTHQWIHVTVWVIIITKRLLHWRVYSQVSVLIGNFLNVLNRWLQSKEREKWDPI